VTDEPDPTESPDPARRFRLRSRRLLGQTLRWELAPQHWLYVIEALDALAAAFQSNDPQAITRATESLASWSPGRVVRVSRVSSDIRVPADEQTRKLVTTLVHAIDEIDKTGETDEGAAPASSAGR
jgi:hypothetical protein